MPPPYDGAVRFAYATSATGRDLDADLPLLQQAAERHGLTMVPARWDDPTVDWNDFDVVVVRSCWDYIDRRDEFLAWAERVPSLRNDARTLRWNTDKTYLRELEDAGVRIISTAWDVRTGDDLGDHAEWVVKPTI